jgi:tripartite-type tricarboxylate transporter receptor subunit TctC
MNRLMARAAFAVLLGLCAGTAPGARAAGYPDHPITIVVPAAPGGGGDFAARLLADGLTKSLDQGVIVENRAGASGNIAALYVARAKPDGYTLLLAYSGTHVANPALYHDLPWDPVKSFAPVALVITAPQVIVVNKNLPVHTLRELVDYARAHPGEVNYASSGIGSVQQIDTELLALRTGTKLTHIPYKGAGAALADLLSGRVSLLITTPPSVVGYVQGHQLNVLAIASKTRHPLLPDVPTTAQAGVPGIALDAWFALYAPAGTPPAVVEKLSAQVKRLVESEDFKWRAEQAGTYATYMGPRELDAYTRSQLTFWSGIIRQTGIRLE